MILCRDLKHLEDQNRATNLENDKLQAKVTNLEGNLIEAKSQILENDCIKYWQANARQYQDQLKENYTNHIQKVQSLEA